MIHFGLPDPAKLGIPETVLSLAENKKGLLLAKAEKKIPCGDSEKSKKGIYELIDNYYRFWYRY